jgi:hypothetical protein
MTWQRKRIKHTKYGKKHAQNQEDAKRVLS